MEITAAVRAAAAIAVAAGSTHTFQEPVASGAASCEAITGSIAAQASGIRPSFSGLQLRGTGSAEGSVHGPIRLMVTRKDGALAVQATIHSASGELHLAGQGTHRADEARRREHHVTGTLQVAGGTGAYERIAGSMRTVGLAELGSRTLTLSYTGSLCSATSHAEGGR